MPTKTPEKKASGGRANALQKPLQLSVELAAVVGSGPLPRGQVVSKMWDYIRSHNLQNPENRREILADDRLRKVSLPPRISKDAAANWHSMVTAAITGAIDRRLSSA
jgi:chromatin remodeling complex protein RSC6